MLQVLHLLTSQNQQENQAVYIIVQVMSASRWPLCREDRQPHPRSKVSAPHPFFRHRNTMGMSCWQFHVFHFSYTLYYRTTH